MSSPTCLEIPFEDLQINWRFSRFWRNQTILLDDSCGGTQLISGPNPRDKNIVAPQSSAHRRGPSAFNISFTSITALPASEKFLQHPKRNLTADITVHDGGANGQILLSSSECCKKGPFSRTCPLREA